MPAFGRAAARLDEGGVPRIRPQRAQRGRGVKGARPHLHVIGLQDHASALAPIVMEGEDHALEGKWSFRGAVSGLHNGAGLGGWPLCGQGEWAFRNCTGRRIRMSGSNTKSARRDILSGLVDNVATHCHFVMVT